MDLRLLPPAGSETPLVVALEVWVGAVPVSSSPPDRSGTRLQSLAQHPLVS